MEEVRICRKCMIGKPITEFYQRRDPTKPETTTHRICKACKIQQNIYNRLGVTEGDYHTMLEAQRGRCAICGTDNPGQGARRFMIDHDHSTGKIRGLLCSPCNLALGPLAPHIHAAVRYLAA